ncbi:MAG: LytR/AlgR family response regulator transcription factor [Lachnospiraceae bacterium]
MRIAVCDDEKIFISKLVNSIQQEYKSLDMIVDIFLSGEELIKHYRKNLPPYDIILLDIEMKQMNGFQVAETLADFSNPIIIFITSHEELACDGYKVSAFRFLTKPVHKSKLIEAIEAAQNLIKERKTIFVHNSLGECILPINSIIYIEAQNQHVLIVTENSQYKQKGNIGTYENELQNDGFFLIHRSYLVNLRFVKGFNKREIVLADSSKLPLSRLRVKAFSSVLHAYIKRTAF